MRHVFGPVPSRRLGRSLGIDPVPLKTCNWNCVYCQLGRTSPLVAERREWIPRGEILAGLETELAAHPPGDIDWVTFVASGETTLHCGLGWMIAEAHRLTDLPIAVITNGSLLYLPEVRDELMTADAVLPSLDAGDERLFRRINRPHPQATFERLVQGLFEFGRAYRGKLWVEVMLVRGLNDDEAALRGVAAALRQVRADAVHLNLPTRPPAEPWVKPTDQEGLMRASAILGENAEVVRPAEGAFEIREGDDIVESVLDVITRHPMRQDELRAALLLMRPRQGDRIGAADLKRIFEQLDASGKTQRIERNGTIFYAAAGSRFAEAQAGGRWSKAKKTRTEA
jgi:wyosine [tRNA(Phe)-imidazoG37] synthetase (radical SAM superfamily)